MARIPAALAILLALGFCACVNPPARPRPGASPAHMNSAATTKLEILERLERLNTLLARKDPAIAGEFVTDADVLLIGSEQGEIARGSAALAAFFERILQLPVQLRWEWRERQVTSAGSVAWIFADGEIVVRDQNGETRAPYRLTGVLERREGIWRWRLFHGSEPAK